MKPMPRDLDALRRSRYSWPWRQLRIPQAHRITRGDPGIVVAVIDLGYRPHPHHQGHLWINPRPVQGDLHGWDCHDDDASLEYGPEDLCSDYLRGHHAFVVGEVIACAPECRVMVLRVGYGNRDCWWRAIDWAVGHGARVLCLPHGYLPRAPGSTVPLFYQGTDFTWPEDNPELRRALDDAWTAGCLVFSGTADNRGRRVAFYPGLESMIAVGSSNRQGKPADICASADYVEIGAPGGQRSSRDPVDRIWCTGGRGDYIPFTGGCMAAGFAAGVAALVWSRFPALDNHQVRQLLRSTAGNRTWEPRLGWGILDAGRAVGLRQDQVRQAPRLVRGSGVLSGRRGRRTLRLTVENRGALDVARILVTVYSGDPRRPAAPEGTMENPVTLITRQIGHAIGAVPGLRRTELEIELAEVPRPVIWLQLCVLDRRGSPEVQTIRCPCTALEGA